MKKYSIILLLLFVGQYLRSQSGDKIYLYESRHSEGDPALYINLAKENKSNAAVLIIPGGGYAVLAYDREGAKVESWYTDRGVHTFILEYSIGQFDGSGHKHPDMINDAKRAMRIIRHRAEQWGINPDAIGVMGFSAGGHLASTLATHFDDGDAQSEDPIERESCYPNFCVLAYPVIMMDGAYTHWGSRRFLLGPTPSMADVKYLNTVDHVGPVTPPTFLFHTSDDKVVPVQNSINYYLAMRKYGVPVEMHIFEHGRHGAGLEIDDYALGQWAPLLENWLTRWKVILPDK